MNNLRDLQETPGRRHKMLADFEASRGGPLNAMLTQCTSIAGVAHVNLQKTARNRIVPTMPDAASTAMVESLGSKVRKPCSRSFARSCSRSCAKTGRMHAVLRFGRIGHMRRPAMTPNGR